jgi:hypothetical protein
MKKITLFFCFSFAVFFAEAQLPIVATPTIIPQNPTAASFIKVVTKVTTPNPIVVVIVNTYTVTGLQIKIKGCYGQAALVPPTQSQIDTITIGQLPPGNYQISQKAYLSSTNQHCTPIDSNQVALTLTVSSGTVTTSISPTEWSVDGNYNVYPNPSVNSLFIRGISTEAEASIFSVTGALISKEILNNKNSIDTQNLPAGLYFITITDKGKNQTTKFIKSAAGQ